MRSICKVAGIAVVPLLLVMSSPSVALAGGAAEFERIDPSYYQTDANSLIDIDGARGVVAKRRALIRYIWAGKGLPSKKLPGKIEKDIADDRYAELYKTNLERIDKLTIDMDYGLNSIVYHFIPEEANNKLFVLSPGTSGRFPPGQRHDQGFPGQRLFRDGVFNAPARNEQSAGSRS